jgi:hypothetical protein
MHGGAVCTDSMHGAVCIDGALLRTRGALRMEKYAWRITWSSVHGAVCIKKYATQ